MSKTYLIIVMATVTIVGMVRAEDTTNPTTTVSTASTSTQSSPKRQIRDLISSVIEVCDGKCASYGRIVTDRDTESETCSALNKFEDCLSARCENDIEYRDKLYEAQEKCDGCSVHMSTLFIVLSTMLGLLI